MAGVRRKMRNRVVESERMWLWSIVIMGGMLRLYGLGFQSLWLDEGLQYYVAVNNSIVELFAQIRSFHPPLSFLINHLFLRIQESEVFLRLPSALFGIASLPVFYILARDLTAKHVALTSTLILAFSPFHVWYSQEGRMYAQVLFFSLLSSVVLLRALRHGGIKWWAVYVVVSTAGMYTQIFMLLALLAQVFWVLLYQRDRLVVHLANGAVIFTLFLPWVIFLPWVQRFFENLIAQPGGVGAAAGSRIAFRAGFSWESIPYTFFAYASGFSWGPTVAELHENRSFAFLVQFAPEVLFAAAVVGMALLTGVSALYKLSGARLANFSVIGLSIPIFGSMLYALAPRATYNVRYSMVAFPYFCIIVGAGLTHVFLNYKSAGVILSLGIVALFSMSLVNYFSDSRYAKEDIRSAVAFWRAQSRAEPLLSYQSYPVVSVYLRNSEKERHSALSRNVVSDINLFLSNTQTPFVYVLLARDWRKIKESAIREVYDIQYERSYPGVKMLKISNPQSAREAAGSL